MSNSIKSATINGQVFTTQKALKEYADSIKRKYQIGDIITNADKHFMMELLRKSDQYNIKAPCDEPELALGKALGGTVCWYLIDESSGDKVGISTPHAIRCAFGGTQSIKDCLHEFKQAARETVLPQILRFKQEQLTEGGQYISAISGTLLENEDVHIDHAPPNLFDTLLYEFVNEFEINPLKVGIKEGNGGRRTFVKQQMKDAWSSYHQGKTVLRVVSIAEHKALTEKPNNDWNTYIKLL